MTASLEVNYRMWPIFTAEPNKTYFLDRPFLSRDTDMAVSRAPDAPCLRFRSGSWWIDNDSNKNAAKVVVFINGVGRIEVPQRCSFALPDGEIDLYVWDGQKYRISLVVSGSNLRQTRPGPDQSIGKTTQPGLDGADANVLDLFRRRQRTRTTLAALYREHLVTGSTAAQPLSRDEVRKCMGFASAAPIDAALQDVQRAIWGELGHDKKAIAEFLINHGHLKAEHMILIPHHECEHNKRR